MKLTYFFFPDASSLPSWYYTFSLSPLSLQAALQLKTKEEEEDEARDFLNSNHSTSGGMMGGGMRGGGMGGGGMGGGRMGGGGMGGGRMGGGGTSRGFTRQASEEIQAEKEAAVSNFF